MIITISGKPGSGKSSVAKLVAKKLNLKHYSSGDFMREMAEKRGISLMQLSKLAQTDPSIDREIDKRQIILGEEQDNFVIDARLAFHFIPNSIKIFLDVTLEESANRIFKQNRKDELYNISLEETKEIIKKRMNSEKERYKKYYNVDYTKKSNYDKIINTTNISKKQVVDKVVGFIKNE